MEIALPATLHSLSDVSARTKISRSALYREIINQRKKTGEIVNNTNGRLRVVHVGRSVRVREQDLIEFIDSLAKG
jgi:hypothetical protein